MMVQQRHFIDLYDIEARASLIMRRATFEVMADGVLDRITHSRAVRAFDSMALMPRYLVDVGIVDTATTVLGSAMSLPIIATPFGLDDLGGANKIFGGVRRATADAGAIVVVPSEASFSVDEVGDEPLGVGWCELGGLTDRHATLELIAEVQESGCPALYWNVDCPYDGGLGPTLDDLQWLRSETTLALVVRGILNPRDARNSVDSGADAVVVANHRRRAVDGALPAIEALSAVREAVGGRCEILLEGAIRRGTDVMRALALGADAVCVGRPIVWGLAAGGQEGVRRVLDILRDELEFAMVMCGVPRLNALSPEMLVRVDTNGVGRPAVNPNPGWSNPRNPSPDYEPF